MYQNQWLVLKACFFDINIIKVDTSFLTENLANGEYAFSFCDKLKKLIYFFFWRDRYKFYITLYKRNCSTRSKKKINVISKKLMK